MQLNKEIITSICNEKALKARALKESKERKDKKAQQTNSSRARKQIKTTTQKYNILFNIHSDSYPQRNSEGNKD